MNYKYYFRNRPPSIGTHPKNPEKTEGWNPRQPAPISGYLAWGYVEYSIPLNDEDIKSYELFEDRIEPPKEVKELIKFANDEGFELAISTIFEYKEYGIVFNNYLKSLNMPFASKDNIIQGFRKLAGV